MRRTAARRGGPTPAPAPPVRDPGWWRSAPGALREGLRDEVLAGSAGRYRIRRAGRERSLVCLEAPTLSVRVEPGMCVSATAARSAAPGTIFLDGAAQGEPFVDAERDVYNLDHHEGCVRAFTLAACEQAMVLLRRGLDLRRRDFCVVANDIDLDSVLAIWVLLNHLRLGGADSPVRARILPLLRLEGNVDALGLGCEDLCALPEPLLAETRRALAGLLERERAARAGGFGRDPLAFVAAQLRAIDRIAYAGEALEELLEIDELARAELPGLGVAVVCRADGGIYEVERELRRLHGERLALVVLQKHAAGGTLRATVDSLRAATYSLRATSQAAAARLERIYAWLNQADPGSNGSRAKNRWGGAGEIGGSPRRRGSRLSPAEIAAACRDACAQETVRARLARLCAVVIASAAPLAVAAASRLDPGHAVESVLLLFVAAGVFCLARGRRAAGWYGLRSPEGLAGISLLPVALAAAAAGGVWLPAGLPEPSLDPSAAPGLVALVAGALGLELIFRGFAPASLLPAFAGRARAAAIVAPAALYAALLALLPAAAPALGGAPGGAAAAFVFGLAAGAARLRSESLLLPLGFAAFGVAARLAFLALL